MKLQLFYTADGSLVNRLILSATRGEFAHVGILLTMTREDWERLQEIAKAFGMDYWVRILPRDPDGQYRCYFESCLGKDDRTGKTGVRGPYPFLRLSGWYQTNPLSHKLHIQDVPLAEEEIWSVVPMMFRAVKEIHYAKMQLWHNWLGQRLGRGIALRSRSKDKWTCVEFAARVITAASPVFAAKYLELGDVLFDELAPSCGRKGKPGLFEMVEGVSRRGAEDAEGKWIYLTGFTG